VEVVTSETVNNTTAVAVLPMEAFTLFMLVFIYNSEVFWPGAEMLLLPQLP
jgi:hypothetical protein